jgi:hypothetical protein
MYAPVRARLLAPPAIFKGSVAGDCNSKTAKE